MKIKMKAKMNIESDNDECKSNDECEGDDERESDAAEHESK